jgi:hypothetical protein
LAFGWVNSVFKSLSHSGCDYSPRLNPGVSMV